uniref:Copper transport protein n=1 Tax=Phallusia mammillata TaxID=59560 RepID=A0A6F9DTM4_9ASCI|nr:high affinity copper uptake protein 1-like [Phallusia mammillata]
MTDDDVTTTTGHKLVFSGELPVYNLFAFWRVESIQDLIISCLALFCFGLGHEYLKSLQVRFAAQDLCRLPPRTRTLNKEPNDSQSEEETKQKQKDNHTNICRRFFDTATHVTLLLWSYLLMLSAMTFNPWIFASSVGGCGIGYLLFHRMPATQIVRQNTKEKRSNRDEG